MKRFLKITFLITALVLVVTALCSCRGIDQLREQQAFFNGSNIIYNGKEYVLFPNSESMRIDFSGGKALNVTEKDVPVLISFFEGSYYDLSKNGEFIKSYDDVYYCREDKYSEYLALSKNVTVEGYCYQFEYINAEGYHASDFYILSDEEAEALLSVISEENLVDVPDGVYFDYEYYTLIEGCTENLMFRIDYAGVYRVGTTYYAELLYQDPTETAEEHIIGNTSNLYRVPAELNKIFDKMTQAQITAQDSIDEHEKYYYDEYDY